MVSDQTRQLRSPAGNRSKIVMFYVVRHLVADMTGEPGSTDRTFFRRNHPEPLLRNGMLRMTHPDQPNHPGPAYVLTESGPKLDAGCVNGKTEKYNED